MNIKALLKKLENGEKLSVKEIEFLVANDDSLTTEQKGKLATINNDNELDEDKLKAIIADHAKTSFEKNMNDAADAMVAKFLSAVNSAKEKKEVVSDDKIKASKKTAEFLRAISTNDRDKLKALTTSDDDTAKAGYTIPLELRNEVLRVMQNQYGVARRLMRYVPFGGPGNTIQFPKITSNPVVYWTDEKAPKRSTQPGFNLVELTLKKLAAIVPWTDELMEDSLIDLNQLIGELIGEAMAKAEDDAFLAGTGSPFTGVLYNSAVQKVRMAAGESFDEIKPEYLMYMQDAVPTSMDANAGYVLNKSMLSVVRTLKDNQDRFIFQEPTAAAPGTIWGKPYTLSDSLPTKTQTGINKPFIIYGDLKKTCLLGDKQNIRVKLLDQATITDTDNETVLNLAEQDMSALRFVERVGYVCALPEAIAVLYTDENS